jgi:putative ABC transport system permease protein
MIEELALQSRSKNLREIPRAERSKCPECGQQVWLANRSFNVIGVLNLFELAPDLDRSVFIGNGAAETYLDHDDLPTRVLVRTDPAKADQVLTVLAATANPQFPEEVTVDKPSDALEAQEAADDAFTALCSSLVAWALPTSW